MKISYLVSGLEAGGAQFAIPDIARLLGKAGYQVHVIAFEPRDMGAATHLDRAGIPYRILAEQRRSFLTTLFRLVSILRAEKPDIIWTSLNRTALPGQIAGKLLGIPVVTLKNSTSIKLSTRLGRHVPRLWIADSPHVANVLKEKLEVPQEKILSLPLYIAQPDAHPAPSWDGRSPLHIGSTGRLHEVKNYDKLIEGIALFGQHYPQWGELVHLSLAGDGPQRGELEQLIREKNLAEHVTLRGFLADVPSFLGSLQLYAQPSRFEGMCLAAHEAMNMSLPVMATAVGEMRNSVQDGKTGFILHGDIPRSVCETLATIFQQPELLHQYGQAAKNYIDAHYSHDRFLEQGQKVIDRLATLTFPRSSKRTHS